MQTLTRPGVVVNRSFVEKLGEIVRPFSVDEFRQIARLYREHPIAGVPEDVVASTIIDAEKQADSGGVVSSEGRGFVTDSNAVTWNFPREFAIPWDYFDDVSEGDFTLRAGYSSDFYVRLVTNAQQTSITLTAPLEHLEAAAPAVSALLDEFVDPDKLSATRPPFRVFIGHGGDRQWEAVKRFVESEYEVSAFETHDRLGQQAYEVVERMIAEASVAVIVMTAADRWGDKKRARQNVVHELGFAQGRLGARNTIILVEEGIELFSNVESIQQVRFAAGEIFTREDEVLAALANRKRELHEGIAQ